MQAPKQAKDSGNTQSAGASRVSQVGANTLHASCAVGLCCIATVTAAAVSAAANAAVKHAVAPSTNLVDTPTCPGSCPCCCKCSPRTCHAAATAAPSLHHLQNMNKSSMSVQQYLLPRRHQPPTKSICCAAHLFMYCFRERWRENGTNAIAKTYQ